MKCSKCDTELRPDNGAPDDPATYQFNNALWIAFHGGYGMFVDNLDARLPTNTEDRWLRDEDGDYLLTVAEGHPYGVPVEDPAWEPTYNEERILPGQPDYEAVLCHDCAHALCDSEPWLKTLLNPYGSHAHRQEYHTAHPDHQGWDYDR